MESNHIFMRQWPFIISTPFVSIIDHSQNLLILHIDGLSALLIQYTR